MPLYFSFLLRLWQAGAPHSAGWRASLEDPHTHRLAGFENLDALCAFLRAGNFGQLPVSSPPAPPAGSLPPDSPQPE